MNYYDDLYQKLFLQFWKLYWYREGLVNQIYLHDSINEELQRNRYKS